MEIDLHVNHNGNHGFFSYCTVALNQICIYITQNKKLPIVLQFRNIFLLTCITRIE